MLEINQISGPNSIALVGRLDTTTAPQLEQYCADHFSTDEALDITVDMKECDFVSSAGLRVIIAMQKHTSSTKGTLVFQNTPQDVMDVFTMTGFDKVLTFQ